MINWPKVDAVVAHLEEHPEEHDQSVWGIVDPCRTTACMAGRTMLMFAPDQVKWETDDDGLAYLLPVDSRTSVPELAAAALGLPPADAQALFYWATNLNDIKTFLARARTREACDA